MQRDYNLSDRGLYEIAHSVRKGTNNSIKFENKFNQKLKECSQALDHFFEIIDFEFVTEKNNVITEKLEKGVVCTDLKGLIQYVTKCRDVNDVNVKFGIDGGGGFLKFCMSLQIPPQVENDEVGQKKKNCNKKFSDSGVKRLFIIFSASGVQENCHNISLIWSKLNINEELKFGTLASDVKMIMITCGLQTNSCSHPCPYCDISKNDLQNCGCSRTVSGCRNDYKKWVKSGSVKKNAKDFNNCVNMPLLPMGDTKILCYIPPPELHLLLGAVNTVYDKMLSECGSIVSEWALKCHANRKCTHGSRYSFEGNDCNKLLNNIHLLDSGRTNLGICKYIGFFKKLKLVVDECFGQKLDPQYKVYLKNLKQSFMDLEIPITPKLHIIFEHVSEFCEFNKLSNYETLLLHLSLFT